MLRRPVLVLSLSLVFVACSNPFGADTRRVVGRILSPEEASRVIEAPDSVEVSKPFMMTVNSFGSSSCTRPDGVDLTLTGNRAIITPFDLVPTGQAVCTADRAARPHPVQLQFTVVGTATIQAWGHQVDDQGRQVYGSVERSVIVRP